MTRSPWDREYARTQDEYIWGTAPSSLARRLSALLPARARVLDLGCGEGRDSVFFATRGFDVTGVDVSAAGLDKAARLAGEHGVTVRWVRSDLACTALEGDFDLIYSCGAIHYVPRAERPALFLRLKDLTRTGGWHAHIVFTDRLVYVEKGEVVDYFGPGELTRAYADWGIVERKDGRIACAQDGTPHHHSIELIVARPRR